MQKILARAGIASRRAAEKLIVDGRVRVNGKITSELGAKADARADKIEVDGKRIFAESPVYIVLHKPRGVVSTMLDPEGRPTVRELLSKVPARVYPIGRLDFATSGVLLATNDGEFADGLLHPRKAVPKTYVLKVTGVMQEDDLERWRTGIQLEDGITLPADVKFLRHEADKTWFELTIREGKNQQIRRMGDATGFRVMRLARIEFAGISSEGLRPGDWRALQREELMVLRDAFGVPKKLPPKSSQSAHGEVDDAPERRAPRPTTRPTRPAQGHRPDSRTTSRNDSRSAPRTDSRPTRPDSRSSARPDSRAARPDSRTTRVDSRPARTDTRPARTDSRSTRTDSRPTRGESRPNRAGRPNRSARSGPPSHAPTDRRRGPPKR